MPRPAEVSQVGMWVRLFLAACAGFLWLLSDHVPAGVSVVLHTSREHEVGVYSSNGTIAIAVRTGSSWASSAHAAQTLLPGDWWDNLSPVSVGRFHAGDRYGCAMYAMPWLIPLVPLAAWAILGAWRFVEPAPEWDGAQCLNCGYDLQASPRRCPECGTENTWRPAPKPPQARAFQERLARFTRRARQ